MTEFVGFAVVLGRNGERDVQLVSHRAEMQISTVCERNGNNTHLARLHSRLQAPYKHGDLKRRIETPNPKF
jgi:hypothetical protein